MKFGIFYELQLPRPWKAGVMSGAIQLEEIDTESFTDRYGKLAVSIAPAKPAVAAAG